MATARSLQFDIGWDVDKRGLDKANESTDKLKSKTQRTGEFLQQNKERMLGFTAVAATGLGFAVRAAGNFEEQMARVENVAGATAGQMNTLREQAMQLGIDTSFTAQQAAEGQEFLARAGFETQEVMETLPGVLDLAAASQMELGRTADIASNVLQGFQLEAEETGRVVDTLAAASANSNTNVQQLGDAMSFAAPAASGLGFSIEETAAAIGIMSNAGIQGGRAGRTLRMGLSRLASPTEEAKKQLSRLGIELTDGQDEMLGFNEIISQFETSMQDMSGAQRQAALSQIFGQRAATGLSAIIREGSEELGAFTEELRNSAGITEEMAKNQLDTLNGALKELRGSLNVAAINLGSSLAPSIILVSDAIRGALNLFNRMPGPVQNIIGITLGLGTALLGVATAVGFLYGPITTFAGLFTSGGALYTAATWLTGSALPAITSGLSTLGGIFASTVIPAIWSFTTALLANPITWIVAGVAALTYGLYKLANNWDFVKEKASDALGWIDNKLNSLVEWFGNVWPEDGLLGFLLPEDFNLGAALSSMVSGALDSIPSWLQGPAKKIFSFIGPDDNANKSQSQINDRRTVNRTNRNIQQSQTSNKQENNIEIKLEGGNNDEETVRKVRREVYKIMDEGAASAATS